MIHSEHGMHGDVVGDRPHPQISLSTYFKSFSSSPLLLPYFGASLAPFLDSEVMQSGSPTCRVSFLARPATLPSGFSLDLLFLYRCFRPPGGIHCLLNHIQTPYSGGVAFHILAQANLCFQSRLVMLLLY